jgi:hypothetical protein
VELTTGKDVLADWKTSKFILADKDLTDTDKHVIVLTDVGYWVDHVDTLVDWCMTNNACTQGMTVEIDDDKTLTHFILRWS